MKKWILALIVAGLLLGGGLTWALLPVKSKPPTAPQRPPTRQPPQLQRPRPTSPH